MQAGVRDWSFKCISPHSLHSQCLVNNLESSPTRWWTNFDEANRPSKPISGISRSTHLLWKHLANVTETGIPCNRYRIFPELWTSQTSNSLFCKIKVPRSPCMLKVVERHIVENRISPPEFLSRRKPRKPTRLSTVVEDKNTDKKTKINLVKLKLKLKLLYCGSYGRSRLKSYQVEKVDSPQAPRRLRCLLGRKCRTGFGRHTLHTISFRQQKNFVVKD